MIDTTPSTVLILGLGASGLAMARWCAARGWALRVWDSRPEPPQAAALAHELPAAQRLTGELAPAALDGVTRVLKSPGLSPQDPRIAPLLKAAREAGVKVQGELDLFVQALAMLHAERGYAPKLLAVTGTNGKTTTTAMTRDLVARAGRSVVAAGNIGPTLLDTLAEHTVDLPEVWVLELSSFQLAGGSGNGVRGFEPDAAAVLNLSQDHLDWHGSMAAYAAAKGCIFGAATLAVVNRDDPAVEALVPAPAHAATPATSTKGRAKVRTTERAVLRFGLDAPHHPGDFGLLAENGVAWLVRALPDDVAPVRARKGVAAEPPEMHLQRLMPADALRVRGRHNAANALAALALATAIGCPLAPMLHALRDYGGEPHRLQWVATVGEVDAYDDSKGTNVGATVAALDGLGADKAPGRLVVILGGDGKGQDFAPLAAPLARHARAVATIGRDAATIEAVVAAACPDLPCTRHATMDDAVAWCLAQARPGDAVLLSPACASLDMYRDYAHRAEAFVQAVQLLAHDRGQA